MTFKLSQKQRIRLVISLAVLFSLLGGWVLVRPAWEEFQEKHTELQGKIDALPPDKARPESLGLLIRRITQTRGALEQQRNRFPIAENVSQLLVELQGILSGSDITRFYPTKLDEVNLPALASADIHVLQQKILVDVEGDFFALRNFLAELESFPHPLQVRAFEIARPKSADPLHPDMLTMHFAMSAYLLDRSVGGAEAEQRALDDLLAEVHAAPLDVAEAPTDTGMAEPVEILAPPPLPPRLLAPAVPPPPVRRPPAPPQVMRPAIVARPPDETAGWRIVGIVYARESHTAIIQVGASQVAVASGDEVSDGWLVERIDPRRVVVRKGAFRKSLEYPEAVLPEGSGR